MSIWMGVVYISPADQMYIVVQTKQCVSGIHTLEEYEKTLESTSRTDNAGDPRLRHIVLLEPIGLAVRNVEWQMGTLLSLAP
jgi:hypothetical protein